MNFEETGLPRIDTLREEHALLRMALEWRRKLLWGKLEAYKEDLKKTIRAIKSYLYHTEQEFGRAKDYFHLRGQDNIHRYLPLGTIVIRLHAQDSLFDVLARLAATRIAGNLPVISIPEELNNAATAFLTTMEGRQIVGKAIVRRQSDEALIASMAIVQRIRYAAPGRVPEAVLAAAAKKGFYIARAPVLMEGRIELLHYCQNQSLCDTYHRYGNLGDRSIP
jgi:RHH-type proline utilization regulon transcriptional repressor/proline dehydrogenase/delta 1-pyrroline-5-carboxylate dehydrogenase